MCEECCDFSRVSTSIRQGACWICKLAEIDIGGPDRASWKRSRRSNSAADRSLSCYPAFVSSNWLKALSSERAQLLNLRVVIWSKRGTIIPPLTVTTA